MILEIISLDELFNLKYEIDEQRRALKVYYPIPLTDELKKYTDIATSFGLRAENLGLSLFKEKFSTGIPVSKAIYSRNDVVDGIEIYDGVLHELDGFMILEEGMKKKEYEDFIKFFHSEKPGIKPEYLPGALKFTSNLLEHREVREIIYDLQRQVKIYDDQRGEEARKLLTQIVKALIPQRKRGIKPKITMTGDRFLHIKQEIEELKRYLQTKRKTNKHRYDKKKEIQKFYETRELKMHDIEIPKSYKLENIKIDKKAIEEAINKTSITDIVLSITAWKLKKVMPNGPSFDRLKKKYKTAIRTVLMYQKKTNQVAKAKYKSIKINSKIPLP